MTDLEPIEREVMLRDIQRQLPDPIQNESQADGVTVFVGGDPGDVIVRISGGKVSVSVYAVRWDEPHTPVVRPKIVGTLNWKRLPAARTMPVLHSLIESAIEIRRSKHRKCERCGETKPPEWMHDAETCQGCVERDSGVVY